MYNIKSICSLIDRFFSIDIIPISLVDSSYHTLYCRPKTESYILPQMQLQSTLDFYNSKNSRHKICIDHCFSDYYIGLIDLGNYKLFLGPVSTNTIDFERLAKHYGKKLSPKEIHHLSRICLQSIPISLSKFVNTLSLIYEFLFHEYLSPSKLIMEIEIKNDSSLIAMSKHSGLDRTIVDSIIYFEAQVYDAVISGSKEKIDALQNVPLPFFTNFFPQNIASWEYITIPLLTVITRAAIRGGADSITVFQYYDECLPKFRENTSSTQFLSLFFSVVYKNAEFVNKFHQKNPHSFICRECEKYILSHINHSIKISDIAEACGYSERQIQRIFKKDLGMTVTEYINNEKLNHAALLLYATNYSISDICRSLGYISQSYFSKKFKEKYGCRPAEFNFIRP